MEISNWRLGGGDIEFMIMGINPKTREYLVKVLKSPECPLGSQYWACADTLDFCHDDNRDVLAWKKEIDLE